MKLDEKHMQFAVTCYAQFMPTGKVVSAFMEEFADELPKPPPLQTDNEEDLEQQINKDEYIADWLRHYHRKYQEIYGNIAEQKFEQDLPKINEQIEKDYGKLTQKQQDRTHKQNQEEQQQVIDEFNKDLRNNLINNLRRYSITHSRFPNKYRELFYQARQQYIDSYRNQNDSVPDTITAELESIYGYIKQQIFQARNSREAATHARLAHTILRTIDARSKKEEKEQQPDN